uniref:NADH:ubiquinone reductase (H(+)-translocating) n=1 Tax=Mutilla europaea TaxID=2749339 RepID=A0A7M4C8R9_9HYME|nr:NADH dehydrogenase subunit 5 [Mutilla europaea]
MFMSLELFMISLILGVLGLLFYLSDNTIVYSVYLCEIDGYSVNYYILLDYYSFLFGSIITFISVMIMMYSYWYVEIYSVRYSVAMLLFIMSMLLLVFSPMMLSMLLGWDGLGVVSFYLVMFYYGSETSVSSALVTLYYNRLGDGFILAALGMLVCCDTEVIWGFANLGYIYLYLILLGFSTKSAQFPFMSWLPKAMAAPTPVSALVHSSTLVTAGVYMIIRYNDYVYMSLVFMVMSLLTMFISGLMASMEWDVKKLIAYSTLSQLGLMMFGLVLGLVHFVYFHMLIHAIFKSMMFMGAGVMIHGLGGWQDLRMYGMMYKFFPLSSLMMVGGCMSLMGMYFMSGYYSKDVLIEMMIGGGGMLLMVILFFLSMFMTFMYCFRLIDFCLIRNYSGDVYVSGEGDGLMGVLMIKLFLGTVVVGFIGAYIIIDWVLCVLGFWEKIFTIMMIWVGLILYLNINMGKKAVYLDMDYYYYLKNFFFSLRMVSLTDSYWMELYMGKMIPDGLTNLVYGVKDYSIYFLVFMAFAGFLLI